MSKHTLVLTAALMLGTGVLTVLPVAPAHAAKADVKCHLEFNLSGWSIIYKHAEGAGTVTCNTDTTRTRPPQAWASSIANANARRAASEPS